MKLSEILHDRVRRWKPVRLMEVNDWSLRAKDEEKKVAQLEAENKALREYVELTQSKWEEFGCEDGIVTVKYPWAIQERLRELALLTDEN